jgi:hypothetical protein
VHLRRALLLFAIVLGLAAVAASVSRPRDSSPPPTETAERPSTPSIGPGQAEPQGESGPGSIDVNFDVMDPKSHRIETGQAATVVVEVPDAGQVSIEGLGMTAAAEQVTPARFDVLASRAGSYPITFTPADSNTSLDAGTLVVKEAPQ